MFVGQLLALAPLLSAIMFSDVAVLVPVRLYPAETRSPDNQGETHEQLGKRKC